ncbi:MAG TPA: hypothetical protein VNW15_16070 [Rhizomicrobium sp.]|nr:hypothetical protein [Rhizomicrobium sp.]
MIRIGKSLLAAAFGLFSAALAAVTPAMAANSVSAGVLTVERPTLISAGFDWRITGDDNHNATATVQYRKKGDKDWKTGLPLLRIGAGGETVGVAAGGGGAAAARYPLFKYVVPNMMSGSLFDLTPDTDYEAQFTLSDPDGGKATKMVTFHTRKEPVPATGGKVYHVYPVDWKGPKQEPSFASIMGAYYQGLAHYDYENAYPVRVQPGDTILVHAGLYIGDRFHYINGEPKPGTLSLGNYFDGTYYLTGSGTPDKPIVIKGAGDGEVIFDGDGAQTLFNLMGGNYNYFEGITVRNTNVAFLLGIKDITGSSGFTLKHSKIYNVGRAIQDDWSGSKDFYIADNDLNGRHDPDHMMGWTGQPWMKFNNYPELLLSEYSIKIYGQGHVVAYNKVTNFHDGIDIATYGVPDGVTLPDGSSAKEIEDRFPESDDFYGNDISNMGDNCFEMDGSGRNMRVFRNRCFNLAEQAISVQPGFGGPNYWIRNLIYSSFNGALKYIEGSAGIVTYNNTIFAENRPGPAQNMHYRNNLFLGIGDLDPVFALNSPANTNTADYDGFRPNPGKPVAFEWDTPDFAKMNDYTTAVVRRQYKTLPDFVAATGQEKHGILVDYDSFMHVTPPNMDDPQHIYDPADFDFRLKPNSPAVDAGIELPNITDGFAGKAPDLGAYEVGQALPHYGPREQGAK